MHRTCTAPAATFTCRSITAARSMSHSISQKVEYEATVLPDDFNFTTDHPSPSRCCKRSELIDLMTRLSATSH